MKRKLVLIFLTFAIFCSPFAVVAFALDSEVTDADKIVEVERKKLSEFTDEELFEYLSDKEMVRMGSVSDTTFWDYIRKITKKLEDDINYVWEGTTTHSLHIEDMREVVEEYYGVESNIDSSARRTEVLNFVRANYSDADSLYTK